jgi:hypothetical protein
VRLDVAGAGVARRSPAVREVLDCHLAASEAAPVGDSCVLADDYLCSLGAFDGLVLSSEWPALRMGTGFWSF